MSKKSKSDDSICVAVRVRPFNSREIKRKSTLCIEMNAELQQCTITPPKELHKKVKKFTFDFVYWSHDSSKKEECKTQRIEQAKNGGFDCTNPDDDRHSNLDVYNGLGKKILENAWKGYNASIFAYGQTGSGKSYSMVGYGEDLGIIPLICNELFERIEQQENDALKFKVQVSMMEIYNENVQDLFSAKKKRPPGGLKVREHPKFGPYVVGLSVLPAKNYKEINDLMERGSKARTVASTQMNQTSSRAHTLFNIIFTMTTIDKKAGKATDKVSKIVLVDLAGSERANATGASGDRLKEGCAINQSLSALGNVISALVKAGGSKRKKVFIPYRSSTLTWLLRESLGGNSRAIMIAALSPASINYEETLSTLQYANRAKQIKNKAIVNEDPNVTMIKNLKKELDDLRKKLAATNTSEVEKLHEQLKASQELIMRLQLSDEEGERKKNEFKNNVDEVLDSYGNEFDSKFPSIANLHPDTLMNNRIIFLLSQDDTKVGKNVKASTARIKLGGVSIKLEHARLVRKGEQLFISPLDDDAKTYVNGELLEKEVELHHFDRVIFGSNRTFWVNHPSERDKLGEEKHNEFVDQYDYLYSQEEFAKKQGLSSLVDEDEQEKLVQQKIKEEMEKINKKKRLEEEKLEKQRQELLKKQKEMEDKFKNFSVGGMDVNFQEQKKKFEEQKKKELETLKKQQKAILEKRRKLIEDAKKQEELQRKIRLKEEADRKRRRVLEKKLLELIPMVYEANDYAKELKKEIKFGVKLVNFVESTKSGESSYKTDIVIETENLKTGKKSIWNYDKFESRFYQMQPLYQQYIYEKENDPNYKLEMDQNADPFWDPGIPTPELLGISMIYLKCLSHMIDMNIWTPIFQGNGEVVGELKCGVIPMKAKDGDILLDEYLKNPKSLIGKQLHFKVVVESARGIPNDMCLDAFVKFQIPLISEKFVETKVDKRKTTLPNFNFEKQYTIENVKQETINYFRNSAIKFEFFAKQADELDDVKNTAGGVDMLKAVKSLSNFMEKSVKSQEGKKKGLKSLAKKLKLSFPKKKK